jgi:2-polyprenyl-3-methyl-5-hydroxy-6-metoxy-1,4-benzoquinol methylase
MQPSRYVDRDEGILDAARGRRVLHLGCVGNTDLRSDERVRLAETTLHWKLSAEAEVVGVDYSADVIEEYRRQNIFHNIVPGNVELLEEVKLEGLFDVVVAADIIEHLSNPGALLEGIKLFCHDKSRIVITTPNAFGLPNFIRFLLGRFRDGDEHVMTFNFDNICNLLKRHGFEIERFDTCFQTFSKSHGLLFLIGKKTFESIPQLGGTIFVVARMANYVGVRSERIP